MKTETILIVFIVLLFLLTLLGSFGGSIRPREPFYDAVPAVTPPRSSLEHFFQSGAAEAVANTVVGNVAKLPPALAGKVPALSSEPTPAPAVPTVPTVPATRIPSTQDQETEDRRPGRAPSSAAGSTTPGSENFQILEKFEVPEAFEDLDSHAGAPF